MSSYHNTPRDVTDTHMINVIDNCLINLTNSQIKLKKSQRKSRKLELENQFVQKKLKQVYFDLDKSDYKLFQQKLLLNACVIWIIILSFVIFHQHVGLM